MWPSTFFLAIGIASHAFGQEGVPAAAPPAGPNPPSVPAPQIPPASLPPQGPVVHFPIFRRGGIFHQGNFTANMDYLLEQLHLAESRFNLTQREVKGNKIVRAPKDKAVGGGTGDRLMGEIGGEGSWYTYLKMGANHQPIETDIDLLSSDFAIRTTSSEKGTKFDDFFSKTYQANILDHPFTNCMLPEDQVTLPKSTISQMIKFAHCKPPRQSRGTLDPSGGIIGLAPSDSLRQMTNVPSLMEQFLEKGVIKHKVFSITLISGQEGLLTLGGTAAEAVTAIEEKIERFLGHGQTPVTGGNAAIKVEEKDQDKKVAANGASDATPPAPPTKRDLDDPLVKRQRAAGNRAESTGVAPTWRDMWKWSPVEGADGWWQTLMRGAWVDGVKVLKNQPCVIDLNVPFILAPPQAVKQFYAGISGSKRLDAPYNNFWAFPCNNPPVLHLEFGGWRFPVMRGMRKYDMGGGPNGKFSLGKANEHSGYCVGAVVETRMGVGDTAPVKKQSRKIDNVRGMASQVTAMESGMLAGNGMRDVWVLGEQAFRGLGIVFDMEAKEIGFRTY